ncbi:NUDIX hydrolase [Ferrimonas senticii]|uniref:NUDIX hydrolase n=1 Tax=Ferrimonas senticii TaxID=394566 RepID=UPI0003FE7C0F|nr:NUDIX domain-containing protein [Ferrimonas senticii]
MANHIDKLAWLHIKDGKVLCVRSHGKQMYYVPGGKREAGETDQQALLREIEEELQVKLLPESVRAYGQFSAQADGKPVGTLVKVSAYQADFSGELTCAAEIAEMAWLDSSDLAKCSVVVQLLFADLHAKGLIN